MKAASSPHNVTGIIVVNNCGISDTVEFVDILTVDIMFDFHHVNIKTLIKQKQAKV